MPNRTKEIRREVSRFLSYSFWRGRESAYTESSKFIGLEEYVAQLSAGIEAIIEREIKKNKKVSEKERPLLCAFCGNADCVYSNKICPILADYRYFDKGDKKYD